MTDPAEWMDDYHRSLYDSELVEAANQELNQIAAQQQEIYE